MPSKAFYQGKYCDSSCPGRAHHPPYLVSFHHQYSSNEINRHYQPGEWLHDASIQQLIAIIRF